MPSLDALSKDESIFYFFFCIFSCPIFFSKNWILILNVIFPLSLYEFLYKETETNQNDLWLPLHIHAYHVSQITSLCKDVFQYLQYLILKPPDSTAPSYILEDRHNTNPCCHLLKLTHSHPCADCPADT